MDKAVIYTTVKEILISEFEIDADSISLEKRLDVDLDMDSLDAVDLLISLGEYVKEDPDPALFKNAITVGDLVDLLVPVWKEA